MKLLLTSDSHDHWTNLESAIRLGHEAGCDAMLFAGDLVEASGLDVLRSFNGPVHFVLGNNDGRLLESTDTITETPNLILHRDESQSHMQIELASKHIFMSHLPRPAELAALSGIFDVCIHGHLHQYRDESLENGTRLLCPGEVIGNRSGTPTAMILDLDTMTVTRLDL